MPLNATEGQKRRREKLTAESKYEACRSRHREFTKKSRDKKDELLQNLSQRRRKII